MKTEQKYSPRRAELDPPRDYGADTWADDGPFAVPSELRKYYVTAEPPDIEVRGYMQNGIDVVEQRATEVVRVADPGAPDRAPRTVTETIQDDWFVHKSGPEYFRVWLHDKRLIIAARAKQAADRQAAIEAAWPVCSMCGLKASSVCEFRLPDIAAVDYARRLRVVSCRSCLPVLDHAARMAFAELDASRELDDGRRAGDVAAEVVARELAARDGV